jgi:hypothetical protein
VLLCCNIIHPYMDSAVLERVDHSAGVPLGHCRSAAAPIACPHTMRSHRKKTHTGFLHCCTTCCFGQVPATSVLERFLDGVIRSFTLNFVYAAAPAALGISAGACHVGVGAFSRR